MVKFVHNCRVLCFHGLAHWAVRTPPPSRLCGWGEQDDHKLPCNTCATRTSKMSLLSSLLELQGSKQDSWGIFHLGFHAQVPRSCTFCWLYIAGFLIFELNLQKSALVEPRQQKVRLVWHGAEKQLSIHCSSQTTGQGKRPREWFIYPTGAAFTCSSWSGVFYPLSMLLLYKSGIPSLWPALFLPARLRGKWHTLQLN